MWKRQSLQVRLFSQPPLWELVRAVGWRQISAAERRTILDALAETHGRAAVEEAAAELLDRPSRGMNVWGLAPAVVGLAPFIIGPHPPLGWTPKDVAPADEDKDSDVIQTTSQQPSASRATKARPVREKQADVLEAYCNHLKERRVPFTRVKEVKTVPEVRLRVVDLLMYREEQRYLVAVRAKLTKLQRHDLLRGQQVESFQEFVALRVWAVRSAEGSAWTEEVVTDTEDATS